MEERPPSAEPADDLPESPILLVEDDARIRQVIRWALEDEGFVVEIAADGRQALEQAARRRPALIVLDMMLPILNGAAVADGLRAIYTEPPPILLVTADGRAPEKARQVRAYAHVSKPFQVDELIAAVRGGLQAG